MFKPGGWEPDARSADGGSAPDNCVIMCLNCYTAAHAPRPGEVLSRPVF